MCWSCGGPVEPDDGSFHFDFGWIAGPRPTVPASEDGTELQCEERCEER